MQRRTALAAPLIGGAALALSTVADRAEAQPAGVAFDEMLIPGSQAGTQIYLRNKRPEGGAAPRPDRVILCVFSAGVTLH